MLRSHLEPDLPAADDDWLSVVRKLYVTNFNLGARLKSNVALKRDAASVAME